MPSQNVADTLTYIKICAKHSLDVRGLLGSCVVKVDTDIRQRGFVLYIAHRHANVGVKAFLTEESVTPLYNSRSEITTYIGRVCEASADKFLDRLEKFTPVIAPVCPAIPDGGVVREMPVVRCLHFKRKL